MFAIAASNPNCWNQLVKLVFCYIWWLEVPKMLPPSSCTWSWKTSNPSHPHPIAPLHISRKTPKNKLVQIFDDLVFPNFTQNETHHIHKARRTRRKQSKANPFSLFSSFNASGSISSGTSHWYLSPTRISPLSASRVIATGSYTSE